LPLVHSKEQLAVAIWLHRRRTICGSKLFSVPNRELYEELGLSRWTKYRALDGLEEAGVIAVVRDGQRAMLVRLLW
jgi:DNA-binding GntR family transcriptional regulator